jgi:hypothetical protein
MGMRASVTGVAIGVVLTFRGCGAGGAGVQDSASGTGR